MKYFPFRRSNIEMGQSTTSRFANLVSFASQYVRDRRSGMRLFTFSS